MVRHTIVGSTRPLLVAGHGVRLAGAQQELFSVLDKTQLPVVTTFNGFDLVPSNHPCFVGRIGTVGDYSGNNALAKCDLLIMLGTRNNRRQVSYKPETFAPQARKIVVDCDSNELDKYPLTYTKHCVDVKKWLGKFAIKYSDNGWLFSLRKYSRENPMPLTTPYKFIRDFTRLLPERAVVVCGNGTACVTMFQVGIVKKGQRIFWNSGCAAMGYDIPATIGACIANKQREVYCITGDGSIQMNLQELQTIKHYNLPVKIIVLNNNGYHSLKMTQDSYFESDYIGCNKESGVSFPDLRKIAYAYGITYLANWKDVIDFKGKCICEVDIGNNYVFSPKWTRRFDGKRS